MTEAPHLHIPINLVGVPFDDTILVTHPFNGTVAAGKDIIKSIGGIGNIMAHPAFDQFLYHIFHVPSGQRTTAIEPWIKEQHAKLNWTFHEMQGEQPRAFVIEAEGASSRQSVVYGHFANTKSLPFAHGSIIHLCYLENTPCLIEKESNSLLIGDFNNAMVCEKAVAHNTPLLDILLLSLDENAAFKSKIGFNRLKEGCFIIAHEPLRVVLSRMEGGRPVELARLENQHYLPLASNLTGNGDIFTGYILLYLQNKHQKNRHVEEAILSQAVRHAQEKTAAWLSDRISVNTAHSKERSG